MTTETFHAISLWQPYASLIACRAKQWETRHWPAPARLIGQRVAIHAAKRRPTRDEVDVLYDLVSDALGFCHWADRLPYGVIVCTAVIGGCHRVDKWDGVRPVLTDIGPISNDGFGNYSTGRWCWSMWDVQAFRNPIPAVGRQGWWTWTNAQEPARDE